MKKLLLLASILLFSVQQQARAGVVLTGVGTVGILASVFTTGEETAAVAVTLTGVSTIVIGGVLIGKGLPVLGALLTVLEESEEQLEEKLYFIDSPSFIEELKLQTQDKAKDINLSKDDLVLVKFTNSEINEMVEKHGLDLYEDEYQRLYELLN